MTRYAQPKPWTAALVALSFTLLSACGGSDSDSSFILPTAEYVVTATAAPDFSAGGHSIVNAVNPRQASETLDASGSDLAIAAYGEYFYRIERFGVDTIRKYAATAPATSLWGENGFSTNDPGDFSANAYDMVFVNDSKAYLIRYGAAKAWVVNPSAETEATFKTGELDLSAYADADGNPEMESAVIVGNKLFISMQRYENFATQLTAYVAVFDIDTNTEIETGTDLTDAVMGIPLPVKNPQGMSYDPESEKIYLLAGGKLACGFCGDSGTPAEYTGGIISIDPNSYAINQLVDDGDDDNHPYGNLSQMAIVSNTQGYFIGYNAYQDNTLFRFNPSTGVVETDPIADLDGLDLSGLGVDREDFLWIGKGDLNTAKLIVLDTTTDLIDQEVSIPLNPQAIAFGEIPAP